MKLAPIALFVYNRLYHTGKTIASLQKNSLAKDSDLFIFSDGAKSPDDALKIKAVRNFIKNTSGFRSLTIIEREENLGLANSIMKGVTYLCKKHGKVIVLEDDLVTSPYFLAYMNDALDIYENDERVISIHGYVYPVAESLPETFFLRGADCWGWATWERGWDIFEPDGNKLIEALKKNQLEKEFNFEGSYNFLGMLDLQVGGKNDSWAIRWYASAFLKDKLTLYPAKSLVLNIGNDNSGTHCAKTDFFSGEINLRPLKVGGISIEDSVEARSAFVNYLLGNKNLMLHTVIQRTQSYVKSLFRWRI